MKDEDWGEAMGFACTDCRFFDSDTPHDDPSAPVGGDCRRYPIVHRVMCTGWCGEFDLGPSDRAAWEAERNERLKGKL